MAIPTSILDALCPYLDLPTALRFGSCDKEVNQKIKEYMNVIVHNDDQTFVVKITKMLNNGSATIDDVKNMTDRINNKDVQVVTELIRNANVLKDWSLQDIIINKCVLRPSQPKEMDAYIMQVVSSYLHNVSTDNTDKCSKFLGFTFLLRLMASYIKWVIKNGHQNHEDLEFFHSHYFWSSVLRKITYFNTNLHVLKGNGDIRGKFQHAVKINKKYILAMLRRECDYNPVTLYVGAKDGIYMITKKGQRRYF